MQREAVSQKLTSWEVPFAYASYLQKNTLGKPTTKVLGPWENGKIRLTVNAPTADGYGERWTEKEETIRETKDESYKQ